MFYKKKDIINKNSIRNIKDVELESDYIEKNILIPDIIGKIKAISDLFKEMKEKCDELQNEKSECTQQYKEEFELALKYFHSKDLKLPFDKMNIKKEAQKLKQFLLQGISTRVKQYLGNLNNLGEISN